MRAEILRGRGEVGAGTTAAELRASLEKAKRLRDLERGITEEKVFSYLLAQSTVQDAKTS